MAVKLRTKVAVFAWLQGAAIIGAAAQADSPKPVSRSAEGCAGTSRPQLSCESISAQAALEQALEASRQADLATWQTSIGAITLISAGAATFFAWRAAFHTKRSADLVGQSNTLAKINAENQSRPYLFPSHAAFRLDADGQPVSTITIKNFGQTPAIETSGWSHSWVESFPLVKPLPEPTADDGLLMSVSVLGPGAACEYVQPHGLPLDNYSSHEINAGRAALYVYGGGTYSDIFGRTHSYRYRYFAHGEGALTRGRLAPYLEGNEMRSLA